MTSLAPEPAQESSSVVYDPKVRTATLAVLCDRLLELGVREDWVKWILADPVLDSSRPGHPEALSAVREGWAISSTGDQVTRQLLESLWTRNAVLENWLRMTSLVRIHGQNTSRSWLAARVLCGIRVYHYQGWYVVEKRTLSKRLELGPVDELFKFPVDWENIGIEDEAKHSRRLVPQIDPMTGTPTDNLVRMSRADMAQAEWEEAKAWIIGELKIFGMWSE